MKITFVFHKPHSTVVRYAHSNNERNHVVYEVLTSHGIAVETAIDCASWCELAPNGDSYNTDSFDIYVSYDDEGGAC